MLPRIALFPNPLPVTPVSHCLPQTSSFESPIPVARGWPFLALHHLAQTQALSGRAKRAELYREEAETLRERAGRLPRLQEELRRCRERLQVAEACKGQLEVSEQAGLREAGLGGGAGPGGGPAGAGWSLRSNLGLQKGVSGFTEGAVKARKMAAIESWERPSGGGGRWRGKVEVVGKGGS